MTISTVDFTATPRVYAQWVQGRDAELESWLDSDFLPETETVSGAVRAERLSNDDGSLVIVWLDAAAEGDALGGKLDGLAKRGGDRLSAEGGYFRKRSAFGQERPAPVVSAIRLRLKPRAGAQQAAREWLDGEHAPRQLTTAGAVNFRGYEPEREGGPFLNLWGLEDLSITNSVEWTSKRDTPWRNEFWGPNVEGTQGDLYRRDTE